MKFWTGLLGFVLLIMLVASAMLVRKTDFYDRQAQETDHVQYELNQKIDVILYNLGTTLKPPRKQVYSNRFPQQEKFKEHLKEPFEQFSKRDWNNFWNFIYKARKNKFAQMKRWRRKSEMESFLKGKFPNPFARFGPKQWTFFWSVIEEDKGFKHVAYSDTITKEEQVLISKRKAVLINVPKSKRIIHSFE